MYYNEASNSSDDAKTLQMVETTVNSVELKNLKSNKQYVVYVTASNGNGESKPSETSLEWTNPIIPAYAEVNMKKVSKQN